MPSYAPFSPPFPIGSHLKLQRTWPHFTHHGVVVTDGNVVDYSESEVRLMDYRHFAKDDKPLLVPSPDALPVDQIVHRAMYCVGERRYNLLRRNCEHLASWCVTGRASSVQVSEKAGRLAEVDPIIGLPLLLVELFQPSPWDRPRECSHCRFVHGWTPDGRIVPGRSADR